MRKTIVLLLLIGFWTNAFAQSGRVTEPSDKPARQTDAVPREIPIPNPPENQLTKTEKAVDADEILKVETALVTIPVSVIDRKGHFVTNLRQQDFQIFEDDKPQEVAYFAATEQPVTIALLIDVSDSTEFKIGEIQDAATKFVKQLKPVDKVMIIAFDEKVRVLSEVTSDREKLFKAIRQAKFHGSTSLYDAVDFVVNRRLNQIQGRKAIVLFSDGVDTTSKNSNLESTLADVEEFDATLFTIHYDTYKAELDKGKNQGYGDSLEEYKIGADYVQKLADKTGGRLYEADSTRNLENAFFNIAEELRWQYSIGYYPPETGQTGDNKQIKVKVNLENVAVRARNNYVVGKTDDGKRKNKN